MQRTLKTKRQPHPSYPKRLDTVGDHLRKHRLDLGLKQKEVATIIGVSADTIYAWETKRHDPTITYMGAIINFLDYYPYEEPTTISQKCLAIRRINGWSQKMLAEHLNLDPSTIGRIEQKGELVAERYGPVIEEVWGR